MEDKGFDLSVIMEDLNEIPSVEILEAAGLSKMWSHPFITGEEGVHKLYARVTEEKVLDMSYVAMSRNLILRDYCKEFLRRHGVWPALVHENEEPETLKKLRELQAWFGEGRVKSAGPEPDLSVWAAISPEPTQVFEIRSNLISLLKDRSLAVSLEQAVSAYAKRERVNWTENKVLLRFLTMKDAGKYFLEYMSLYVESLNSEIVSN